MQKRREFFTKSILNSEAGLSLIEIMIGSAILVGLGFSTFYANTVKTLNNGSAATRFRCESATQSQLAFLQGQGTVSSVNTFIVSDTSRNAPSIFTAPGIETGDLWSPSTPAIVTDSNSGPTVLANALLIGGSVRNIAAIFNKSPSLFCGGGTDYPALTEYLKTTTHALPADLSTSLKIQPYDIKTGALVDCGTLPSPLFLAPMGRGVSSSVTGLGGGAPSTSGNVRSDLGFLVTIKTTFTDRDQANNIQSHTCSIQNRFQYQRDVMSPLMISASTLDPNPTVAGSSCVSEFTQMHLAISSPGGEQGLAFLCQDLSTETKPSVAVPCTGGSLQGGNQPQMFSTTLAPTLYDPNPPWVPCDRVKLCGVGPTSTSIVGGNQNPTAAIVNLYNLPADCTMAIRAVAVDGSGNVQAAVNSPNPLDISTLALAASPVNPSAFLYRPSCGTACSPNGTWSAATNAIYPNTYYSCSGCP